MGSYGIIVKKEEVRKRVQKGDFNSAQKIIDTMALKKVKNIADLILFADIYAHNERYDEAMELLNRVYKKSKTRRVLFKMVSVSIKRKDIEDAQYFLQEYELAAPDDYNIFIFRYKIDKMKKEPYNVLIDSLKKLKKYIYMEKCYELAKLYYKAGMEKECIEECSEIILWFGEGSYVEKAKFLKAYYLGEMDKDEMINMLKNRAKQTNKISNSKNIKSDSQPESEDQNMTENQECNLSAI